MDSYSRIEAVIKLTEAEPELEPEMLSLLGARLIILIAAAYETEVERIFCERADKSGDRGLAEYCKSAFGTSFRNPSFTEIKKHMERLAEKEWGVFRKQCADIEISQWDELIKARHTLAHTPVPGYDFKVAKGLFNSTQNVLRKLEKALL